jgi:glycosyltransferase involved in cell wall biosynthesis
VNDIGVIALVPDRWQGVWTTRQYVLSRLAQHFEVVWVEPPRTWREYWLGPKLLEWNAPRVNPGIRGFSHFDSGRWLPDVYRPRKLHDWLNRRRLAAARGVLERKGCKRIVLYLWRYEFAWALPAAHADLSCYHVDDEYQFSTEEKPNDPAEVELLRSVDLVIIHSPKLMEKKGHINPDTISVPNGVDFSAYSSAAAEPNDLKKIGRPRIGYVGVVKTQLNFDLVDELSRRRPEWSFVLVGPQGYLGEKPDAVAELALRPNVWMIGSREHSELPAYTQHMDVCIMCYEVNSYTDYIYPLKLHEYLATGRPIVSVPIPSVVPFGNVIRLAQTPDEWEAAIVESLEPAAMSAEAVAARREIASRHDWDLLVRQIADAFQERLAAKE